MKKILIALALCLVVVGLIAAPVMAAAQKVDLAPAAANTSGGGGFVVFNNSAGPNNLEMTVALKGAPANTTYDIYLFVDGVWYNGAPVGTVTTNKQGNANLHINVALDLGTYALDVDVATPVSGADQYLTTPWGTTSVTFK